MTDRRHSLLERATGDLDINSNVTIKGRGSSQTFIDGNSIDRVFHVSNGSVKISGLTIQHGRATEGSGLLNSDGNVMLTSVVVANNVAAGSSGAAGADGPSPIAHGGDAGAGGNGKCASGGGRRRGAQAIVPPSTEIE